MVTYANVSPGQVSSTGSVFADSPGLLRENGFTTQFIVKPQSVGDDLAICSGSADSDVTDYQPVLPVLGLGDTLNIFGVQAVGAADSGQTPVVFQLTASGNDTVHRTLMTGTANRNGPWFESYELPVQIEGPAKVWVTVIGAGAAPKAYNRIIFNILEIRRSDIDGL